MYGIMQQYMEKNKNKCEFARWLPEGKMEKRFNTYAKALSMNPKLSIDLDQNQFRPLKMSKGHERHIHW